MKVKKKVKKMLELTQLKPKNNQLISIYNYQDISCSKGSHS